MTESFSPAALVVVLVTATTLVSMLLVVLVTAETKVVEVGM